MKKNRGGVWGLVAIPLVLFASLALGVAMGGMFCYLTAAVSPSDWHDVDYANRCAMSGLLVGLLIGLAWSFVILTEHHRDGEE
jgi:hypothetical protein